MNNTIMTRDMEIKIYEQGLRKTDRFSECARLRSTALDLAARLAMGETLDLLLDLSEKQPRIASRKISRNMLKTKAFMRECAIIMATLADIAGRMGEDDANPKN